MEREGERVNRYFKITEITKDEFACATGETLKGSALEVITPEGVYVAMDDDEEQEFGVFVDDFEKVDDYEV